MAEQAGRCQKAVVVQLCDNRRDSDATSPPNVVSLSALPLQFLHATVAIPVSGAGLSETSTKDILNGLPYACKP